MRHYFDILERITRFVILLIAILPITKEDSIGRIILIIVAIILGIISIVLMFLLTKHNKNISVYKLLNNWQSTVDDLIVFAAGGIIALCTDNLNKAIWWFMLCVLLLLWFIIPSKKTNDDK